MIYAITFDKDNDVQELFPEHWIDNDQQPFEFQYHDDDGNPVYEVGIKQDIDHQLDLMDSVIKYRSWRTDHDDLYFSEEQVRDDFWVHVWYDRINKIWYGSTSGLDNDMQIDDVENSDQALQALKDHFLSLEHVADEERHASNYNL